MCKDLEQQKLQTQFQFTDIIAEERTKTFEHQVLNPQNLQQEIETIRDRESAIQGFRIAIYNLAMPTQQVQQTVRPAEPQPVAVAAAPQEESWKERRAKQKRKERNLKRGKKLTKHADEFTADLVEIQETMNEDIHVFRDNGYGSTNVTEELTDVLRSMQGVKVTADMFTDENYVGNYAFLRETLEKGRYLARIATNDDLMRQLRQRDINLYGTALYWKDAASLVEQMMTYTNITHGLDKNARVIEDSPDGIIYTDPLRRPEAIGKAREKIGSLRNQFQNGMATIEEAHVEAMERDLQAEFEKELVKQKSLILMDSTEEQRGWLESASLAYNEGDVQKILQDLKTLIEGSNELYLANKVVVDTMYSDIIRRFEVLGELTAQRYAWIELQNKYQGHRPGSDGDKLWRATNRKLDQLIKDGTDVADNLTSVKNALTRLLEGKLFNPLEVATLESYGYQAEEDMKVKTAPLRELAIARAVRSKWQNEALDKLLGTKEHPGVFRPADPNSQYVTRAVTLFREGDDAYNLQILESLQPFEKMLNRQRPKQTEEMSDEHFRELEQEDIAQRKSYYEEIRRIVEPQVERVMAWDMERFLQMSDEELIGAQKELDDLFGANMFTSDLMKLKHPKMDSWLMKDDILGDRLDEFSHRLTVLRALTDKSRGLSLRKLGELTVLKKEYFGTDASHGKLGDGSHATCMDFAKKQIELGERYLKAEQARWADKRDVYSEAFKTACMEKYQKKGLSKSIPDPDSPLDAVQARYVRHFVDLQPDATQEEKDVRQRLMKTHYHIACWDQEDAFRYAREHGVEPVPNEKGFLPDMARADMGEALFRVFTSYIRTPGAQTQSAEDFRQMLKDLSAGAELQRGVSTDREIFEAREKNRQGCLQFKESLRVSYEYLSRKYGFGLEKLTPLEIYDHWEDILKDFGNVQVEMNFITRIPDIVDMDNQEDKALFHQINYLSILSQSVQNMLLMIGVGEPVDTLMEMIRDSVLTGNGAPAREALLQMGDASGMVQTVRWEQKPGKRRPLSPEDPEAKEARWQKFQRDEAARRN